jgi:DNA-binding NarL/FixJ family response regulator
MEPIKVAIADTNVLLREGLKRILALESDLLVVGEAADEVEIVNVVDRTRPDVLLLDLRIPKRGAVPVLLELKQKHVPTKVLIFSFFPDQESILNTAKAGARGYVLKSILPSALIQAIRKIHRGEIWADRQLNCAETFIELARQRRTYDAGRLKNEITELLSKRELEILALVANGLPNREISKTLFISLRTVKAHVNHILNKLNVKNRTQATLLFLQSYKQESAGEGGLKDRKPGAVGPLDSSMSENFESPPRRRRAS